MSALLWLLVAVPAGAGALLLLAGRAADRVAPLVGVGSSLLVAETAVALSLVRPSLEVSWLPRLPVGLAVDDLSAAMVLITAVLLPLVLLSAAAQQVSSPARFHGVMLVFGAAVLLTATATTLAPLLVGWEVMGATSWALIAHHHRTPEARDGGLRALLTTRAADLGLYAAVGAALAGGADSSLDALPDLEGGWLHLAAAGIAVAALGKAAQLPFSSWLSGAMHAPSQVSALLHSAAMVAMGGYLLLRVSPLLAASGWADDAVAWVGVTTAVLLGAVAVAQTDLKQLLAASTAAQLGFVVLAAGVGGVGVGRTQLVTHAAVKAALFLAAGVLLHALGTKRLRSLAGAGRLLPWVGAPAVVAALALAGVPPLALWASKENLLEEVHSASLPLYVAALGASVLSAVYAGKIVGVLLAGRPEGTAAWYDLDRQGSREVGLLDRVPLLLLATAAAGLGVLALPLEASVTGIVLSTAAVALGLALGWRRPLPARRTPAAGLLGDWLHLDRLTHAVVVRPVTDLARAVATFDDRVLVPAVTGAASTARAAGRGVGDLDDRALVPGVRSLVAATVLAGRATGGLDRHGLDRAVRRLARSTRSAGRWATRPQTGQLHQYYAQAAVALGVAALVLWIGR